MAAAIIHTKGLLIMSNSSKQIDVGAFLQESTSKPATNASTDLENLLHRIAELKKSLAESQYMHQALIAREECYRTLVETSRDLMFRCDHQGRFTFVNRAWQQSLGFTLEEILRHTISDFQAPEVASRDGRHFAKTLPKGPVIGYETVLISRAGKPVPLSFTVVPLRNEEGLLTGFQGTAYDITDRRQKEEDCLRIQKLESIGTLAGGIAHDFNNLLQAILGNIQLAKRALGPLAQPFHWLTSAEKAGDQAKELSYRLLAFSQGGEPFKQVTSITKLLTETVQFILSGSHVSPEFLLDDTLYAIEIDEGQMKQVISNIVINAKEVMPRGGTITIRARNVPANMDNTIPLRDRNCVHISIEDHGVGISPKNLPRVFDPYFTTKGMGSEKGMGLGLTICHSIVTRHGGFIRIDSTPGLNTTVHLYFPQADSALLPSHHIPVTNKSKRQRVLLMDDEDFVRDVTGEMLLQLGYEVCFTKDGDGAVKEYDKALEKGVPFDVVILDLTIPGGTGGEEAILRLLEIDPNVKAILSSGYADNNVINDFRGFGFKGTPLKPFKINELATVLSTILRDEP